VAKKEKEKEDWYLFDSTRHFRTVRGMYDCVKVSTSYVLRVSK
jgi:hypothetical protein